MAQLEGSYPIRIGGEITGSVTVERDGLMTIFSADCRDDGELVRLSVFDGAGKAGYLGVMLPENGRLTLVKRLSRAGLAGFPEEIVCAGVVWEAEEAMQAADAETVNEPQKETMVLGREKESETEQCVSAQAISPIETEAAFSPVSKSDTAKSDLVWNLQPNPWSLFSEPGIKAALSSVRGALTTMENGAVLLAIPTSMDGIGLSERILEAGEVRMIDGTEYVVFRL